MEEGSRFSRLEGIPARNRQDGRALNRQHDGAGQKGGRQVGYDDHKHIKGTKIHVVTTKESLPVAIVIGPANQHEGRKLIPVMESISVKQGRGRPRRRPKVLYADTKYNMPLNKFYLDDKHVKSKMLRPPGKKSARRPRAFDKQAYNRIRSMIEQFNAWIQAFRRVATRYDRIPQVDIGFFHLVCIMVYGRVLQ
jgi:transposase